MNLASRVTDVADPGTVVVAPEVRARVRGATDAYEFVALTPRSLRGYDRAPPLFELRRG